jgi:phage terminase Nu1 subunit (DNA packaging protein)
VTEPNQQQSERLLSSWKEIATCLDRGVRTVQRWEHLGLPVRRPAGSGSNVVLAVESELLEWLSRWKKQTQFGDDALATNGSTAAEIEQCAERVSALKEQIHQIDQRLRDLQDRLEKLRPARHQLPLAS